MLLICRCFNQIVYLERVFIPKVIQMYRIARVFVMKNCLRSLIVGHKFSFVRVITQRVSIGLSDNTPRISVAIKRWLSE